RSSREAPYRSQIAGYRSVSERSIDYPMVRTGRSITKDKQRHIKGGRRPAGRPGSLLVPLERFQDPLTDVLG
ncbi:MAG: hypothetical protein ACLQU9_14835, partial [Acidimicrobiales bacterium]